MSVCQIRPATEQDASLILHFVRELALYEKELESVKATEDDIKRSLFNNHSHVHALICEKDNEAIGFAVYFFNYSTWLAKKGLYLEDLYVTPAARGTGAGKALLKRLAKIAVEEDCGRFEWSVLNWNAPAIEFYESLGAQPLTEWTGYRVTGDALLALAQD